MNDARNCRLRAGLTLLELLIVVVILALAAGLTVPIVQRSFTSQRVDKAASLVRSGLNQARVSSMRSGEIYGFYYFPESRDYRVAPFNRETLDVLKSQRRNVLDTGSNFDFGDDRLPQGIVFLDGETIKDSRSEQALDDSRGTTRDIKPVLFYPDGSSQTAKILLRCDSEYAEVHLRGMTGTSTIVPVDESRLPRNQ